VRSRVAVRGRRHIGKIPVCVNDEVKNCRNGETRCALYLAVNMCQVVLVVIILFNCPRKVLTARHLESIVLVWTPVSGSTKWIDWLTVRCVKPSDSKLRYAANISLMTVVSGSIQSRITATRVSAVCPVEEQEMFYRNLFQYHQTPTDS